MFLTSLLTLSMMSQQIDTTDLKGELNEVVITNNFKKESVGSVILNTKNAVNLADGLSQESIKKSPDRNLSESLKRVGGLTVQGDRFVIVRGLIDRYNVVLLNGALLSSTEPDRRAFGFDIIPSNVVENMMVNKTATSSLPGDFAGGVIQINTKSEFVDEGQSLNFGTSYGTLSTFKDSWKVKLSDLPKLFPTTQVYRTSSLTDKRYYTSLIPSEYVQERQINPLNFNFNYSLIKRVRLENGGFGFVTNVLYRNSNSITYSDRVDYQSETDYSYEYKDRVNNNTQNLSVLFNPTVLIGNTKHTLKTLFNYQYENLLIQRSGKNYDNLQEIDYSNSVGFKKYLLTSQYEKTMGNNNLGINYFWMGRYQPDYRITPLARSLGSSDNMSVVWRDTYRFWSNMNEQGLGFNYNKKLKNISFGVQEQFKYRNFDARVFRYNDEITLSEITNNTDKYDGFSNILSTYVVTNGKKNRVSYSYGLRNENQNFMVKTSDFSGQKVNVVKNYIDLLPSANFKYELNEKDNLRISLSQTVTRPEFREVSNFAFYDFVRNAQVVGNPNLVKGKINNVDFRYERYFSNEENLSTTLFYKNFNNPIEQVVANGSSPSNLILTYSNPQSANSYGIEMEFRKKLNKNFLFYSNLSLINSQVLGETESRPLQGQSPYIINTGVFYNLNKFSVSLFYNKIGERISAVGFNGYSDIYENGRDLVDATVQFKTKKMEFKLSLTDLLSQQTVFYQKLPSRNLINTINEKTISLSLNYKL
jgi:outer membrane receptor protein involved in Fe transport